MIANYHTHTTRCGHASGTEREYIENAIKAGFLELGFSDHAPMPYDNGYFSGIRMSLEQTDDYVNTLLDLRREYEKDIKIHIGFEAEYYPAVFDRFIDFISDYPIDYLIMGQHWMNNEYDGSYFGSVTDNPEILRAYVDQVIAGLSTGRFSYIAHPDLPNFVGDEAAYKQEMSRLIEYTKANNIPLEINMLGAQYGRHYPSSAFWSLASDMSATAIIGGDIHHAKDFAQPSSVVRIAELIEKNSGLKIIDKLEFKSLR